MSESDNSTIDDIEPKLVHMDVGGREDASVYLGGDLNPPRDLEALARLDLDELEYVAGVTVLKVDPEFTEEIFGSQDAPVQELRDKAQNLIDRAYDQEYVDLFRQVLKDGAQKLYGDEYGDIVGHMKDREITTVAKKAYQFRMMEEGHEIDEARACAFSPDFDDPSMTAGVLFILSQERSNDGYGLDDVSKWGDKDAELKYYTDDIKHELGHLTQRGLDESVGEVSGSFARTYIEELDAEVEVALAGDKGFTDKRSARWDLASFYGYVKGASGGGPSWNCRTHNVSAQRNRFLEEGELQFSPKEIDVGTTSLALKVLTEIGYERIPSLSEYPGVRAEYLNKAFEAAETPKISDIRYGLHKVVDNPDIELTETEQFLADNLLESMDEYGVSLENRKVDADALLAFNKDCGPEIDKAIFLEDLPERVHSAFVSVKLWGSDPLESKALISLKAQAIRYGVTSDGFIDKICFDENYTPIGGDEMKAVWGELPVSSEVSLSSESSGQNLSGKL